MNARSEALLEQAKQQGYLVMRYGYNNTLKAHYFEWCRLQKIPAIYVWFHGLSASIDSNTDPVFDGYSMVGKFLTSNPSFHPTTELYERCNALYERCAASMLRSSRRMFGSLLYQAANGDRGCERTVGHLARGQAAHCV